MSRTVKAVWKERTLDGFVLKFVCVHYTDSERIRFIADNIVSTHLIFNFQFSIIKSFPVISAGCGIPKMCRIEGATSASTPFSTLAALFSVT